MSIKSKLEDLFRQWEEEMPDYKGHFVKDGVIDEQLYLAQKTKVLFIAKEPNNPKQEQGDFAKWFGEEVRYTFAHRLAEWSYGILNDFPHYSEACEYEAKHLALKSVAFLNLKKTGGGGTSNPEVIKEHTIRNAEFIYKQIEIINPHIIIGGIGSTSLWHEFLGEFKKTQSGYDIWVFRYKNIKVVDFYHPSNRYPKAMSYSLLQNVIESKVFSGL